MEYKITIHKEITVNVEKDSSIYEYVVDTLKDNGVEGKPSKEDMLLVLQSLASEDFDTFTDGEEINVEMDVTIDIISTTGLPSIKPE